MEFFTIDEVAKILKVNHKAVRGWLKTGLLKGAKIGRIWRIDEEDLKEFIRKAKEGK